MRHLIEGVRPNGEPHNVIFITSDDPDNDTVTIVSHPDGVTIQRSQLEDVDIDSDEDVDDLPAPTESVVPQPGSAEFERLTPADAGFTDENTGFQDSTPADEDKLHDDEADGEPDKDQSEGIQISKEDGEVLTQDQLAELGFPRDFNQDNWLPSERNEFTDLKLSKNTTDAELDEFLVSIGKKDPVKTEPVKDETGPAGPITKAAVKSGNPKPSTAK